MSLIGTRILMCFLFPILVGICLVYPILWSFKTGKWEVTFLSMANGFKEFALIWSKGL